LEKIIKNASFNRQKSCCHRSRTGWCYRSILPKKQGHDVTVKEALPKAGGMLQYGIPSYRMPREIVDQEIGILQKQDLKLNITPELKNR
jgi:hypothetical protein